MECLSDNLCVQNKALGWIIDGAFHVSLLLNNEGRTLPGRKIRRRIKEIKVIYQGSQAPYMKVGTFTFISL